MTKLQPQFYANECNGQQSRTMNVTNNADIMTEMRPNNLRSTGILCICTPNETIDNVA